MEKGIVNNETESVCERGRERQSEAQTDRKIMMEILRVSTVGERAVSHFSANLF